MRGRHDTLRAPTTTEEVQVWSNELLAMVKELRASLRQLFGGVLDPVDGDLSYIDGLLGVLNVINRAGAPTMQEVVFGTVELERNQRALLRPVAWSAFATLRHGDRRRLCKCANQQCLALFYDTTPGRIRRWCSPDCRRRDWYRRRRSARGSHSSPEVAPPVLPAGCPDLLVSLRPSAVLEP